ncbi:50S ribosomal protein L23 [Chlamydiales bacterium]|nr:50S ribosomal protein L23 [Chlamydiales bacterium]
MSNPYQIVLSQYVTEKSRVLGELKNRDSNQSLARCDNPKYVFLVDPRSNKQEIKMAIEDMYREHGVKVVSVNTIRMKPKKRRVRGRLGMKAGFKKAVVTLEPKDNLEELQ